MQIFLLTFLILGLAIFGMSLGVLLNKRELKGSCGGLANIPGMESSCSCSKPCEKRQARIDAAKAQQHGLYKQGRHSHPMPPGDIRPGITASVKPDDILPANRDR